jgi:hypothetical protein
LPHHLRWLHVADFRKLMQLERSGPAVHGVQGHKQCLQLLVGFLGVLVDLGQAVVDAAADVRGQGGEQVIIFVEDGLMLQIRNLLSIFRNQVFGSWGQKSGILNTTWATCWSSWSLSSFAAILYSSQSSGLEVDCNHVQERACAKAGSTLCRSTCLVL